MFINRDNYETFFLMYVDNELSAAERTEVEEFLEQHPDLRPELDALAAVVLEPEPVTMNNRDMLLRSSFQEDLQERLLMHLDGELDGRDAAAVQSMLVANAGMATEWELLQRTKLDPAESILFPDKEILYKRTGGRVVAMRFTRIAIAAALIGAGIFFAYQLTGTKETISNTGTQTAVTKPASKTPDPLPANTTMPTAVEDMKPELAANIKPAGKDQQPKTVATKSKQDPQQLVSAPAERGLAAVTNRPAPTPVSPEREPGEKIALASVTKPVIQDVDVTPIDNNMARTAGLENISEVKNDNHILFLDEENVTRSKTGTFLRKLKRTVERNARIKTSNGIRIAGFELAAR
jgi:hypothetical protein